MIEMKIDIKYTIRAKGFEKVIELLWDNPENFRLGIVGNSGSGRTTILKIIAGLIDIDHSKQKHQSYVILNEEHLLRLPSAQRRAIYVDSTGLLFPHLSPEDNLFYGLVNSEFLTRGFNRDVEHNHITPDMVIKHLDLQEVLRHKTISTLSAGQKQRLGLGRALLSQPKLLLLDEPISALDESARIKVLDLLIDINNQFNIPLIYVSQNRDEMRKLCNRFNYIEVRVPTSLEILKSLSQSKFSKWFQRSILKKVPKLDLPPSPITTRERKVYDPIEDRKVAYDDQAKSRIRQNNPTSGDLNQAPSLKSNSMKSHRQRKPPGTTRKTHNK